MLKLICAFFAWLFGMSEIVSGRGSVPDFRMYHNEIGDREDD